VRRVIYHARIYVQLAESLSTSQLKLLVSILASNLGLNFAHQHFVIVVRLEDVLELLLANARLVDGRKDAFVLYFRQNVATRPD